MELTDLYVSIKGDETPINSTIAALQGSLPASASRLGSIFQTSFVIPLNSGLGMVIKGFEWLFSLLREGNRDLLQLEMAVDAMMKPFKQFAIYAVAAVNEWVQRITAMISSSTDVKNAVGGMLDYVLAGFLNVKIAIDRGIDAFGELLSSGNDSLAGVTALLEPLRVAASAVGVAIRNWPEFFEIAYLSAQQSINNVAELFVALETNAMRVGEYIANNWQKLIVDGMNAAGAAITNLGSNLGKLAYAFTQWVKNPFGGFEFEWTPLLEGFKATADAFPDMVAASFTDKQAEIGNVLKRIAENEAKGAAGGFAMHIPKPAGHLPVKDFHTTSSGVAEFSSSLRQSILNFNPQDVAKAQLKQLERIVKASEDTAAAVKNPRPAVMAP